MILLAPVLFLLALSGCSSEVVPDFTQTCPQFFADPGGTLSPPTIFTENNYKQICQMRFNTHEFATLYDTANRIPVYSAYRFEGIMGCKRTETWYIEPQLEVLGPKMATEASKLQIQNQAVKKDYEYSGYDRGHLAPVYHARSQNCSYATFTLTNAAPQNRSFNNDQWKKTEEAVAKTLNSTCLPNSAYIVTGVVPGPNTLKNRVRIPSHFWTAYCCLDNNQQVVDSHGFLGENINDPVQNMTVSELEEKLTDLYGKGDFRIFGEKCTKISSSIHRFYSYDDLGWYDAF
ncbi:endonuclease domain-containing 1 protein-like [Colossoma macropomum]|uniref:endonuclease domain-containing 1 protein-like n=1 Tax=Colossoma macropomum TaxID=42526 RepID=UPI0018641337|nr:endonuclease domain-containing 1 protein-like [Colossoma macropomum]XP_036413361.1 endonuclease domain-containing 1 protein-like [Colossoma macropomum]